MPRHHPIIYIFRSLEPPLKIVQSSPNWGGGDGGVGGRRWEKMKIKFYHLPNIYILYIYLKKKINTASNVLGPTMTRVQINSDASM